jgi:hypothetical protein
MKSWFTLIVSTGSALFRSASSLLALADESADYSRSAIIDSDLCGEMNYRTGRLDSGTDPYGWYDDE